MRDPRSAGGGGVNNTPEIETPRDEDEALTYQQNAEQSYDAMERQEVLENPEKPPGTLDKIFSWWNKRSNADKALIVVGAVAVTAIIWKAIDAFKDSENQEKSLMERIFGGTWMRLLGIGAAGALGWKGAELIMEHFRLGDVTKGLRTLAEASLNDPEKFRQMRAYLPPVPGLPGADASDEEIKAWAEKVIEDSKDEAEVEAAADEAEAAAAGTEEVEMQTVRQATEEFSNAFKSYFSIITTPVVSNPEFSLIVGHFTHLNHLLLSAGGSVASFALAVWPSGIVGNGIAIGAILQAKAIMESEEFQNKEIPKNREAAKRAIARELVLQSNGQISPEDAAKIAEIATDPTPDLEEILGPMEEVAEKIAEGLDVTHQERIQKENEKGLIQLAAVVGRIKPKFETEDGEGYLPEWEEASKVVEKLRDFFKFHGYKYTPEVFNELKGALEPLGIYVYQHGPRYLMWHSDHTEDQQFALGLNYDQSDEEAYFAARKFVTTEEGLEGAINIGGVIVDNSIETMSDTLSEAFESGGWAEFTVDALGGTVATVFNGAGERILFLPEAIFKSVWGERGGEDYRAVDFLVDYGDTIVPVTVFGLAAHFTGKLAYPQSVVNIQGGPGNTAGKVLWKGLLHPFDSLQSIGRDLNAWVRRGFSGKVFLDTLRGIQYSAQTRLNWITQILRPGIQTTSLREGVAAAARAKQYFRDISRQLTDAGRKSALSRLSVFVTTNKAYFSPQFVAKFNQLLSLNKLDELGQLLDDEIRNLQRAFNARVTYRGTGAAPRPTTPRGNTPSGSTPRSGSTNGPYQSANPPHPAPQSPRPNGPGSPNSPYSRPVSPGAGPATVTPAPAVENATPNQAPPSAEGPRASDAEEVLERVTAEGDQALKSTLRQGAATMTDTLGEATEAGERVSRETIEEGSEAISKRFGVARERAREVLERTLSDSKSATAFRTMIASGIPIGILAITIWGIETSDNKQEAVANHTSGLAGYLAGVGGYKVGKAVTLAALRSSTLSPKARGMLILGGIAVGLGTMFGIPMQSIFEKLDEMIDAGEFRSAVWNESAGILYGAEALLIRGTMTMAVRKIIQMVAVRAGSAALTSWAGGPWVGAIVTIGSLAYLGYEVNELHKALKKARKMDEIQNKRRELDIAGMEVLSGMENIRDAYMAEHVEPQLLIQDPEGVEEIFQATIANNPKCIEQLVLDGKVADCSIEITRKERGGKETYRYRGGVLLSARIEDPEIEGGFLAMSEDELDPGEITWEPPNYDMRPIFTEEVMEILSEVPDDARIEFKQRVYDTEVTRLRGAARWSQLQITHESDGFSVKRPDYPHPLKVTEIGEVGPGMKWKIDGISHEFENFQQALSFAGLNRRIYRDLYNGRNTTAGDKNPFWLESEIEPTQVGTRTERREVKVGEREEWRGNSASTIDITEWRDVEVPVYEDQMIQHLYFDVNWSFNNLHVLDGSEAGGRSWIQFYEEDLEISPQNIRDWMNEFWRKKGGPPLKPHEYQDPYEGSDGTWM